MLNVNDDREDTMPLVEKEGKRYRRLVSRKGLLNIERKSYSFWKVHNAGIYHYYLNLSWWKLVFMSAIYYIVFNLFFGLLFWFDIGNLQAGNGYTDAFFFSLQTMATIGYGNYHPRSLYLNCIVFIEAWVTMLTDAIILALIIAKMARPSRLRHTLQFSTIACVNKITASFSPDNALWNPTGTYDQNNLTISFRVINLRKRQLCEPSVYLLLFRKEAGRGYVMHELDFEINDQIGRSRGVNFSKPFLGLPWIIIHKIDKTSPLFGFNTSSLILSEAEIIIIFGGIDELSSSTFQARWSYIPAEIKFGHKFADMVYRDNNGTLTVDYAKLSETVSENADDDDDSTVRF